MLELGSCLAWPPCLQISAWLVSDTMLLCLHVIPLEAFPVLQFKLASQALSYLTFCFHNITYPYLIFPSSVISLLLEFYAPGSRDLVSRMHLFIPGPTVWHKTHAQKYSRKECICFLIQTLPLVFICYDGTVEVLMEINDSWTLKYNEWPYQIRALSSIQFHYIISNVKLSFAIVFAFLLHWLYVYLHS